jgi:hypothetical protein
MALCYKDRSYCCHLECKITECDRLCSNDIRLAASEFGLPISYTTFPECPHFDEESWEKLIKS